MSRDGWLYVHELREALHRVSAWMEGVTPTRLAQDEEKRSAVERQLFIAGEAAKAVPPEIKALAPEVDWRGLARLRDFLAHAYFAVDPIELWDICAVHVPRDLRLVEACLKQAPSMDREPG